MSSPPFTESHFHGPLRNLGLTIAGTRLESVIAQFRSELDHVGLGSLPVEFFLSTEWGVPFPSTSIAIPFYLSHAGLTDLHASRTGLVEGSSRSEILRYLRHEMGHVVGYAYRLYEQEEWTTYFGSFARPYPDEYVPRPFCQGFVRHLPGWYAQMHPDEDWAETFAVWMTPGRDWRAEYADWHVALAKLEYCDRVVRAVAGTPIVPFPEAEESDESEEDIFESSLADLYFEDDTAPSVPGLDGALRSAFDDAAPNLDTDGDGVVDQAPLSALVRRVQADLTTHVFRWTGHFPERTLPLIRLIAWRADELGQVYALRREAGAIVALTTLVTTLAMNYVYRGEYTPASF